MSAYAAYADAYRLRAQYHAAMAHAARCDADLPPMRRAEAIAHHEAQAAIYADRAARYEADAQGARMNDELTYEQAVAMLPEGETIHSFAGGGGLMLGCDHSRESILKTLRKAEALRLAGPVAGGLGHGLAVKRPELGWLYVETRREPA